MHHYELQCHAKRLICYFQGQGHFKSSYDQNMTISTVSFELLILLLHYHKLECFMEKLDCCVQGQGHSKISKWLWKFVRMIPAESMNLYNQTWFGDASLWQELISKYDHVYCIFWTADPCATKLGLIVHYHKAECFMKKFDCCVQGQGHSKISK